MHGRQLNRGVQSKREKQVVNTKMVDSNPAVSITTLSINGFNTAAKFKDYQTGFKKKKKKERPTYILFTSNT